MRALIFVFLVSLSTLEVQAQTVTSNIKWPVPQHIPGLLFYIQRDPDINTVCYALKTLNDGTVDKENPVEIFWMNYATDGNKKKLNTLQREFGYGLSVTSDGIDSFQMKAVAFPKMKMHLFKDKNGKFVVKTKINKQDCILDRVYIRITGGTALSPEVAYIEFFGRSMQTGNPVTEKVSQ